ncbi:MAG: CBS domain-containing protein [Fuerstiella sp.]
MFKASAIMKSRVLMVTPETTVDSAVELMLEHDVSGVPVVNEHGHLVGMFSETDQPLPNGLQAPVAEYMSTDVTSIDAADSLTDVARAFRTKAVHRMPVTREGAVVGVIGCRDLTRFVRELEGEMQTLSKLVETTETCDLWCNQD